MNLLKTFFKYIKFEILNVDYEKFFFFVENLNNKKTEFQNLLNENKHFKELFELIEPLINFEKDKLLNLKVSNNLIHFYYVLIAEFYLKNNNYLKAYEYYVNSLNNLSNQRINFQEDFLIYRKIYCLIKLNYIKIAFYELKEALTLYPESLILKNLLDKLNLKISNKNTKISLTMIVKNEENNLAECLDIAKEVVDEIIIVDTGSTDRTIEIAKKYTSKIYEIEWSNDFSYARNEALKYASGDWIIVLDADERLKLPNKFYLKNLLESLSNNIGGVICTIVSPHSKPNGEADVHKGRYPRIFKNIPNKIYFEGKVHEQIAPSIRRLGLEFIDSDIVIEHLGYNKEQEILDQKVKRNYKLLLDIVKEEPLNGYAWFQMGLSLGRLNLLDKAIECIEFAIKTNSLSKSILASAYSTLAQFYGNFRKYDKSLEYSNKSLELFPYQQYALNLRAYSYIYLGKFEEAKKDFELIKGIKNKKLITESAFDIEISDNIIETGLKMCVERKILN